MPRAKAKDDRPRVRVYPVADFYLPGVRHVERIVPAFMADLLTNGPRAAFTTTRPADQDEPSADVLEDVSDIEAELMPDVMREAATIDAGEAPAPPAEPTEGATNG